MKYLVIGNMINTLLFAIIAYLGHTSTNIKFTIIGIVIGGMLGHLIAYFIERRKENKEHEEFLKRIDESYERLEKLRKEA